MTTDTHESEAVSIDGVVTTEIRARSENVPSGVIHDLYDAAHEAMGGPLCLSAGLTLREAVGEGDVVLLATGAGAPPWLPRGETDGPLGTASLARALALALGARPVLLTEERHLPPLRATTRACGLNDVAYERLVERRNAATLEAYPETRSAAEGAAERLLEEYDPAAVVSVEKLGPNEAGVIHSITGRERPEGYARVDALFDRAEEAGIPTVGVGDGGNELGFGTIRDAVREIQPYGEECVCPCGGGVATRVEADEVVVGGTSNWGAYGIAAVLALLTETPEALHGPEEESRMLEGANREGANDGIHGRPVPMVDGTSEATNRGVVAILNDVVETGLTTLDRPF